MTTIATLTTELKQLNRDLKKLKQGDYLQGVSLHRCGAGGTASEKAGKEWRYGRLVSSSHGLLSNGKKSQYVPLSEIARYAGMIQRGKAIGKLERQIDRVQGRIAELRARVSRLSA